MICVPNKLSVKIKKKSFFKENNLLFDSPVDTGLHVLILNYNSKQGLT